MENTQALRWAAIYVALRVVAALVGLAVAALGVALGGLAVVSGSLYASYTPFLIARSPTAGAALMVVGLLLFQFGSAAAFVRVLVTAVESETSRRFDTEAVKSDILSVLDDRLSEMHHEVTETQRLVDRLSRDDAASDFDFEFDDE